MQLSLGLTFVLSLTLTLTAAGQQPKPDQLLRNAEAAQQSGDLAAAIADYRALVASRPASIEAHNGLGAALAQHQEYDAAIAQFNEALTLSKNHAQPDIRLALGLAYVKKGDFAAARPQFETVLSLQTVDTKPKKIRPETVQAATLLAKCDLKLNDPEAALAILAPRSFLADQDLDFARVLGLALVRTGKLHDGAEVLRRVGEATNDLNLLMISGAVSFENGENEEGRRDLEAVRRADPLFPGIESLLGVARLRSGDVYAAENAFREALRTNPDDFLANLYLGVLLLDRHDRTAARPLLERALTEQPSPIPALADGSIPFNSAAELEPAVDNLQTLAAANPALAEPHVQLASLYERMGRSGQAAAERTLAAK